MNLAFYFMAFALFEFRRAEVLNLNVPTGIPTIRRGVAFSPSMPVASASERWLSVRKTWKSGFA